jgi:hypothetical protein
MSLEGEGKKGKRRFCILPILNDRTKKWMPGKERDEVSTELLKN